MTTIKNTRQFSSFSASKNHNNNKNIFSLLDFTVAGRSSSSVFKIVLNPVELEPLDLDDLITDEETEEWIAQNCGKSKQKLDTIVEEPEGMLQFSVNDVQKEVDFWKNSFICFILGANPPWDTLEDFIYWVWADYGVGRVSFLSSEVFLVRFRKQKYMEALLHHGHYVFDNRPLIVRPWTPNESLTKAEITVVPVWVRLLNLPLKFWGNCIPWIAGLLGDYVRCDGATEDRTRLAYTRVLIDVTFGKSAPKDVKFLDESGELITLKVEFKWNPILCTDFGGVGHTE
uniref:ORF285 n=1 Tax=Silene latifolia TaxID=37657 RepID=Q8S9E3_SILLA|nr:unnamed protein product [Silene latifolia]